MKIRDKKHVRETLAALGSGSANNGSFCDCPQCRRLNALAKRVFAGTVSVSTPPDRIVYRIFASYERIASQQRAKPRYLVPAFSASVFSVLVVAALVFAFRPAALLYVDGNASVAAAALRQGDRVISGDAQQRVVFYNDEVRIVCAPGTTLEIGRIQRRANALSYSFLLHGGEISVAFHAKEHTFDYEFIMPDSTLRSSGTEFKISLRDGISRFKITQGHVVLTHRSSGTSLDGNAGESYVVRDESIRREDVRTAHDPHNAGMPGPEAEVAEGPLPQNTVQNTDSQNVENRTSRRPDEKQKPALRGRDANDADGAIAPQPLPEVIGVDKSERRLRGVEERALRRR